MDLFRVLLKRLTWLSDLRVAGIGCSFRLMVGCSGICVVDNFSLSFLSVCMVYIFYIFFEKKKSRLRGLSGLPGFRYFFILYFGCGAFQSELKVSGRCEGSTQPV